MTNENEISAYIFTDWLKLSLYEASGPIFIFTLHSMTFKLILNILNSNDVVHIEAPRSNENLYWKKRRWVSSINIYSSNDKRNKPKW